MSSGLWFAITVPKKEYEVKTVKEQKTGGFSKASSKQSLDQFSENGSDKNLIKPKDVPEVADNKVKGSQESLPSSDSNPSLVYFVEKNGPMEETLQETLDLLGIVDAVWSSDRNEKYHQVYFPCDSGERCEAIIHALSTRGFGIYGGSTLAVLPCSVFFKNQPASDVETDIYTESELDTDCDMSGGPVKSKSDLGLKKTMKGFKSMQQQFLKSVTARLTVAQVVESVRAGTQLTFDYFMFVVLASMIAAFGLMDNSSVAIVASMLISPLMGPILAGTFGAVIRDHSLLIQGLKAEMIGLFTANFIGFIIGLICGNFSETWGPNAFPTPEMSGRGQDRALWVGLLIALPSGAGVALSVLGGNAGSLVGVAISASLLPPAVNAGLLWGLASIKHIQSLTSPNEIWYPGDTDDVGHLINKALQPPEGYKPAYRYRMDEECAILGVVSLLLTIVNIICIILAAMLVLKIKEVAPKTSIPTTNRFWKQDIKIARDYNRTLNNQEGHQIGQTFLSEWAKLNGMNPGEVLNNTKQSQLTQYQTLQDMLQDVEDDDVYQTVMQFVPGNHPRNLPRRVTLASIPTNRELYSRTNHHGDVEQGPSPPTSPVKKAIHKLRQSRQQRRDSTAAHVDFSPPGVPTVNLDPDFDGVQLRHSTGVPSGSRGSSMLRRSLQTSGSPAYSLWPPRSKLRRMTIGNRFVVTPVDDTLQVPPLPPRIRYSKHYGQVESNI